MFRGFKFIWAYIDDLLMITKGDLSCHPENWNQNYKILKTVGLSEIFKKNLRTKQDGIYICFWMTQNGIQPINKNLESKVEAIPPKNPK